MLRDLNPRNRSLDRLELAPFLCPGFGSNVSICEGPPGIQSRMHDFRRAGFAATSSAKAGSHPLSENPETPKDAPAIEAIQFRRDMRSNIADPLSSANSRVQLLLKIRMLCPNGEKKTGQPTLSYDIPRSLRDSRLSHRDQFRDRNATADDLTMRPPQSHEIVLEESQ